MIVEIKTAKPSAKIAVIMATGIPHNIAHPIGKPKTVRITKKTKMVGRNLKIPTTVAEIGNIIRGNAVLRMSFPPLVMDLTPPVMVLETK